MKINSSNVTIMVKDMDKAIGFYQSIGLTLKQRWNNHYAMLTANDIVIGLHPASGENLNSGSISIGFMLDDFEEAKALLDQNNIACKLEEDGKSGIYAHFNDLDGTALYFVKPKWG